jgi:NOL1/NOP2/sun family putative RNA methylase
MTALFDCYREIIPGFSCFQESLLRPLPTHLRINTAKTEPEALIHSLIKKGIHLQRSTQKHDTLYFAPGLDSPGNLIEYFLGYIHPQALTSCLASIFLSPRHGSYVLDMCAAPGGKTAHLAQLMNNTGLIVANELYPKRHLPLGHTLSRLGVLNVVVTGYPAQEFPLKHRFDYILADVPCSGEGRFRRTSEATTYRETRGKARLPEQQKRIIMRGFDLLKEGGEMLYATCTYNPDENESVVDFLLKNRDAGLIPIDMGIEYAPGIEEWRHERYDKQLKRAIRLYPHTIDSVGFFMAKIGHRR